MERIELIESLLDEKRKTTTAHMQYLTKTHEYLPGEELYVREAHFILAVHPQGENTMSELASRLDVTQGAATQLASRLEKKGYICREKSREDGRITIVTLTEKGKTFYQAHTSYDRVRHQEISDYLMNYSDEQLAFLAEYEKKIRMLFR